MTRKKPLPASSDGLSHQYKNESDNYILNDDEVKEIVRRKTDFLAGKTTSRLWKEIKGRYKAV